MHSGTAVVMANLPALAEIVKDGKTGQLYPAGNVIALANTIQELLQKPEKREEIGQSARDWILKTEPGTR